MKRKSILHSHTPWNHLSEVTMVIKFFTHTHTHTHTEAVYLYKIFFYIKQDNITHTNQHILNIKLLNISILVPAVTSFLLTVGKCSTV